MVTDICTPCLLSVDNELKVVIVAYCVKMGVCVWYVVCVDRYNTVWRHVLLHVCSGRRPVDVVCVCWNRQSAVGSGTSGFQQYQYYCKLQLDVCYLS